MNDKELTLMVEFDRQFYPKPPQSIEDGDWGIVTVRINEVEIEGQMYPYDDINFDHEEEYVNEDGETQKWKPYKQYQAQVDERYGTISLKGTMCKMEHGVPYKAIVKEVFDQKYNRWSYEIRSIQEQYRFENQEQLEVFLRRAVGTDKQVDNIFATFKSFEKVLEILEGGDVEALKEVHGVGQKTAEGIIEKYVMNKDLGKAFVELNDFGLTNKMIYKLIKRYGSPDVVVAKVQQNPYILADEVDGIGFAKADAIAMNAGFDPHSPYRCSAYIQYYFSEQIQEGHSFVDNEDLVDSIYEVLGSDFPVESISSALRWLADQEVMWASPDQTSLALMKYYNVERVVALNMLRLIYAENNFYFENWEEKIAEVEEEQGWKFTDEQIEAIKSTLEYNVVLTAGYGGTGKTASVGGMLRVLEGVTFAQCALSGKASVNMMHVTGVEGYTIHRLLAYNPSMGYRYNADNPLPYDIIILDELSMVDAELFAHLLCAIKDGAKLIMLGDTGQLTNIGCGNIMFDLMSSGLIPCNQLTKIHRQAAKSAIITKSIDIRHGVHIVEAGYEGRMVLGELEDLEIVAYKEYKDREAGSDGRGVSLIMEEYLRLREQVPNIMDIAVLLPTNTRGTSTYKLNLLIQAHEIKYKKGLNARPLEIGGNHPYSLHVGDKVINTKNNYESYYKEFIGEDENGNPMFNKVEREIYNGNMGIVTRIDHQLQEIEVDFERIGLVTILKEDLANIQLGYAISIHKSQGATIPYVIVGMDYTHYKMLCREILYTGITRAKKHCVLVGDTRAIRRATNTTNVKSKQTFLPYFLCGSLPLLHEIPDPEESEKEIE